MYIVESIIVRHYVFAVRGLSEITPCVSVSVCALGGGEQAEFGENLQFPVIVMLGEILLVNVIWGVVPQCQLHGTEDFQGEAFLCWERLLCCGSLREVTHEEVFPFSFCTF